MRRNLIVGSAVISLSVLAISSPASAQFNLTIFHHSDGESALIGAPGQPQFGGVARFKTKIDQLRTASVNPFLTLSNGDMFLAGPQVDASLSNPAGPFYDAVAQNAIGYDAAAPANHEFDFGPQVARRFFDASNTTQLVANANFSLEPQLSPIVTSGKIQRSKIITTGGQQVGIVGILPSDLLTISSPGNVSVTPQSQLASVIQAEVDALTSSGVRHIILMGQQQGIVNDINLIPQLRNVDLVISGGGQEILSNTASLVPGDVRAPSSRLGNLTNQYPLRINDADNRSTPLVGTDGLYKYIGQLDLSFDVSGNVTVATGDIVRVASTTADATNGVLPDMGVNTSVTVPVQAHVAGLVADTIGRSTVALEGRRTAPGNSGIRAAETNLGNLTADALIWQAARSSNGALSGPIVGLQNGGGIRNNSLIAASPDSSENLSRFDAFNINAFANFVSVIPDMTPTQLKQIVEWSVSDVTGGNGRFGQWGGLRFSYDPSKAINSRVNDVFLIGAGIGGTDLLIIDDGVVLASAPAGIDFASSNFTLAGGDGYPFNLPFINYPVSYTAALENYIEAPASEFFGGLSGLNRLIDASRYAPLGLDDRNGFDLTRRIDAVPEPTTMALIAGVCTLLTLRKRSSRPTRSLA